MTGSTASEMLAKVHEAGYVMSEDQAKLIWLECDAHRKDWARILQETE